MVAHQLTVDSQTTRPWQPSPVACCLLTVNYRPGVAVRAGGAVGDGGRGAGSGVAVGAWGRGVGVLATGIAVAAGGPGTGVAVLGGALGRVGGRGVAVGGAGAAVAARVTGRVAGVGGSGARGGATVGRSRCASGAGAGAGGCGRAVGATEGVVDSVATPRTTASRVRSGVGCGIMVGAGRAEAARPQPTARNTTTSVRTRRCERTTAHLWRTDKVRPLANAPAAEHSHYRRVWRRQSGPGWRIAPGSQNCDRLRVFILKAWFKKGRMMVDSVGAGGCQEQAWQVRSTCHRDHPARRNQWFAAMPAHLRNEWQS